MRDHGWCIDRLAVVDGVVRKLRPNGLVDWAIYWDRIDGHVSYFHDAAPMVHSPVKKWTQ
jgi:hypothetical protein